MPPKADEDSIRASERQRISRDLHNSTSQLLTALQLQIGHLRGLEREDAQPLVEEMAQTIEEIRLSIRQIETSHGFEGCDEARLVIASRFYRLNTTLSG
ncbi:histidine kinase [Sphingomonas telluris]|uniref:histidine kinase n=1 Tax=Sphingomonas telluris TaxID=2907998 RepID=UPI0034507099